MQVLAVAILALAAFTEQATITGSKSNAKPKEPAQALPKIMDGQDATPHQFPHQVALIIDGLKHCSGSIISPNTIITAAHCLSTAKYAVVIAGAHNIMQDGSVETEEKRQVILSKQLLLHPSWDPTKPHLNDLALILLPQQLNLEAGVIDAIALHQGACPDTTLEGREVTISGWGVSESSTAIFSDILHFGKGSISKNTDCNNQYGNIENTHVCFTGEKNVGACSEDGGAPLIYYDTANKPYLAGVASFGSKWGCGAEFNSVFTRVSCYIQLINDNNILPGSGKH